MSQVTEIIELPIGVVERLERSEVVGSRGTYMPGTLDGASDSNVCDVYPDGVHDFEIEVSDWWRRRVVYEGIEGEQWVWAD